MTLQTSSMNIAQGAAASIFRLILLWQCVFSFKVFISSQMYQKDLHGLFLCINNRLKAHIIKQKLSRHLDIFREHLKYFPNFPTK